MRPAEISEFLFTIERDGVPINVVVYMGFVRMSANKESVFTFEKTRSEIITNLICFLRCHFPRLEGLANLINKHIILFIFARKMLVLPF